MFRLVAVLLLLSLGGCFTTSLSGSKHGLSSRHSTSVIRYVKPNDTLFGIGKKFGVDYRVIARRNHISYPYQIYVGQRLYIDRPAPVTRGLASMKIRHIHIHHKKKLAARHRKKTRRVHVKPAYKSKAKGYKGKLRWPVKGVVTSPFGRRGSRMHDGIDIGAKEGTPVHAAASGTVVYADSRMSGYGKLIILRHGNNMFTAYAHNQRMLVRKGNKVRAGDVIGRVGHTGRATGPHLHFEVRQGSTPVNPLAYLPRR